MGAATDLLFLRGDLGLEVLHRHAERADHLLVEDAHAGGDGPDTELGVPRGPDLPWNDHVERPAPRSCHLGPDLDTPARDGQDHDVLALEVGEDVGEQLPSLHPVGERVAPPLHLSAGLLLLHLAPAVGHRPPGWGDGLADPTVRVAGILIPPVVPPHDPIILRRRGCRTADALA